MGYPVPIQIPLKENATFRGICVSVPNEPEYIRALLGSLSGLATWGVWERDENQSGKKSAELWNIANLTTFANIASDCVGEDGMFDCETMKDCLLEIAEAISVNVTVNNSCNVTGGGTLYCVNEDGDVIVNPVPVSPEPIEPIIEPPEPIPTDPLDPDTQDPPDGYDTWGDFDIDACMAANAMVDWMIRASERMQSILTVEVFVMTALFALVVNFLTGGFALIFSAAMMLKIVDLFWDLWQVAENPGDYFGELNADLIANRETLVCEIYANRHDAESAENEWIARLMGFASGYVSLEAQPIWRKIMMFISPKNMFFGMIFGGLQYKYDIGAAHDCSLCNPPEPVWNITYSSGNNGESSAVKSVDTLERLVFDATVFRNTSFSAGQTIASVEFPPGTLAEGDDMLVSANLVESKPSSSWKLTIYRDNSIAMVTQELNEGLNYVAGLDGSYHLVQKISITLTWPNDSGFPVTSTQEYDLSLPLAAV